LNKVIINNGTAPDLIISKLDKNTNLHFTTKAPGIKPSIDPDRDIIYELIKK
jgi:hypothetical protein